MWLGCGLIHRGAARAHRGDKQGGAEMIRGTGAAVGLSYFVAAQAEALLALGAVGEGLAAVDEWLSSAPSKLDRK